MMPWVKVGSLTNHGLNNKIKKKKDAGMIEPANIRVKKKKRGGGEEMKKNV
jgi:hypothetical protein